MEKSYRAELTGVFGYPVDGNPTCVLMEAGYRALGLNYRYMTMEVAPGDLKAAFDGAKAVGMRGFNLTMPHKTAIIPMLDRLTEAARLIGAVNTVVGEEGEWIGENTDGKGFIEALGRNGISPDGKNITILGAGGAARSIAVEAALAGASRITVINRDLGRGEALAGLIAEKTAADAAYMSWKPGTAIPPDTDILIQATGVGLYPDADRKPDIDYHSVSDRMVACDVVFNPLVPLFLKEAARRGAKVVGGLGMLVCQGARNFELWTGRTAPFDIMYDALKREFV